MNSRFDCQLNWPFPAGLFGDTPVGQMLAELTRVHQLPESFVAPFLLGAVSGALGKGLQTESFQGLISRGNLYIAVEAASGIGKTTIGRAAFGPLHQHAKEVRDRFITEKLPGLRARHAGLEIALKRAGKRDMEASALQELLSEKAKIEREMTIPQFILEDTTQEALEKALSDQGGDLTLISTDARKVVKNLCGLHRRGQTDEDIYIKAWSGDPLTINRITRGNLPTITDPCLSMFLAVQPDLFRELTDRQEFLLSGFLARLLLFPADEDFPSRNATFERVDPAVLWAYEGHMAGLISTYRRSGSSPRRISLSPEARALLCEAFRTCESYAGAEPELAGIYRRWPEQVGRIALCLQAAILGTAAHGQDLHPYCVQKARELMWWVGARTVDLLRSRPVRGEAALGGKLLNLVQGAGPGGIPLREAYRKLSCSKEDLLRVVNSHGSTLEIFEAGAKQTKILRMKPATPGL